MPTHQQVEEKLNAVEAEMKRVGLWEIEKPTPDKFEDMGAFGTKTMAFEQWLRWVFIERVRGILDERGEFPRGSQVSQQAHREWQMWGSADEFVPLIERLREFDALFGG
jgi:uncharacterized protein YqcC (DUF446 family)